MFQEPVGLSRKAPSLIKVEDDDYPSNNLNIWSRESDELIWGKRMHKKRAPMYSFLEVQANRKLKIFLRLQPEDLFDLALLQRLLVGLQLES